MKLYSRVIVSDDFVKRLEERGELLPFLKKHLVAKIANALEDKLMVAQYTADGEFVRAWDSARDVQNETGFSESNINKCCNRKIRTYKGYVWMYA